MGDTERRFRGTKRLSTTSDSHSELLSRRRVEVAIDDSESPLKCGGGVRTSTEDVGLVTKEDELSRSGFGADFGDGLDGVTAVNPARDASESLMPFACVEEVSSPESGDVGGQAPLLGCGSMLSRGGRK